MDLIKIIGIGFITVILTIILKEYRKDFAIYIILIGGALILYFSFETLVNIVNFLKDLSVKGKIDNSFISLLLKITGISILSEFAVSVCKDCGEASIANKIDLGGKILVISLSIPVIGNALEQLLSLLSV
ncbi:MAG: hypothetical protein J6J60_07260 [Clostridia bacterium]|nr:hypothetical protein [Clostridia bacterium]